jgi:hypothetical protein
MESGMSVYTRLSAAKLAIVIQGTIEQEYDRLAEIDSDACLEWCFSNRRSVSCLIRDFGPKADGNLVARLFVFDPSLTGHYSESCWDGMWRIDEAAFDSKRFLSNLGLASLNGGLASVQVEIYFSSERVVDLAHLVMEIAGLVDMYAR